MFVASVLVHVTMLLDEGEGNGGGGLRGDRVAMLCFM